MRKLNLGSGWHPLDGYTNVDLYYPADVKADLKTCEFPPNSCKEVIAIHVIEHFSKDDGIDLMERAFRWLVPGGRLLFEWPDGDKCRELLALNNPKFQLEGAKGLLGGRSEDKDGWHQWLVGWVARGADESEPIPEKWNLPGEQHIYCWGGKELSKEFKRIGFKGVQIALPRRHGKMRFRDTQVSGVKP